MRRVFYRPSDGLEVVDVSCARSVDEIKKTYGDGIYDVRDVEDGQKYTFKNGKIVDYVYEETDEQKKEKIIKEEMESLLRAQAIEKLTAEGKI